MVKPPEDLEGTFWWCGKHDRVEVFESVDSTNRIGPFSTEGEAANALKTISEREKRYDAEDSAWNKGT